MPLYADTTTDMNIYTYEHLKKTQLAATALALKNNRK
jgi:hypothetical protein